MTHVETNTPTAGGQKKHGIAGFYIDRLKKDVMTSFVEENDLAEKVSPDASTEQMGFALYLHFQEQKVEVDGDDNLSQCNVCEGICTVNESVCPYCGLKFADDSAPAPVAAKPKDVAKKAEPPPAEPSSPDITDAGEVEALLDQMPAEEPVKRRPGRPKKVTANGSHKNADLTMNAEENAKAVQRAAESIARGDKPDALATTEPQTIKKSGIKVEAELLTTTTLDDAIKEYAGYRASHYESYYAMAQVILKIRDQKLWQLRVDPKTGKSKHPSFAAFCDVELKVKTQNAYFMCGFANAFTLKDVQDIGQRKLDLALRIPPGDDRTKLLLEIRKGMPKARVEQRVREIKAERGGKGLTKRQKAGNQAAATTNAKKKTAAASEGKAIPSDKITIAQILGTRAIRLYQQPASLKGFDLSTLSEPADLSFPKSVRPFGYEDYPNGVRCYYSLQINDKKQLVLARTFMRIDPTVLRVAPASKTNKDGSLRKKAGRPKGSTNKPKKAAAKKKRSKK